MPHIRAYRSADEPALSSICVATADAGSDATGRLDDDDVWSALFLSPYLHRHPELALVLESDDGRLLGYIVGTDDTAAFEEWFGREWWPRFAERWPTPAMVRNEQEGMIAYGSSRGQHPAPVPAGFPAHLHIDLLPEGQGSGWGRVLIEALCERMSRRAIPGVHASVSLDNLGALGFYPRTGFEPVAEDARSRTFGRRLH